MAKVFGLEIEDLPDDVTALEAVMVFKVMRTDEDATFPYSLIARCTDGISIWEAEGMSRFWVISTEDQLRKMATDEDDD
jgi:hypothetical protein